ncbi:MAG: glycosyltransferase [Leptolyngbya sp. ERB_1_1]
MMRIGYLHIGETKHGIVRYGRLLAHEAKQRADLAVIEAELELTGEKHRDLKQLTEVAHKLSAADVVHFQYNSQIWGGRDRQLAYLRSFFQFCTTPRIVTLHDVYYPPSSAVLAQQYFSKSKHVSLSEFVKAVFRDRLSPNVLALHQVIERSQTVLVCTQEEARRLRDRTTSSKVKVVPHFVEARHLQIDRAEARKSLGLDGLTVITLLGFIYSGKGHQLLIEALPQLPDTVKVVFAGGANSGQEAYYQGLMALAEKIGVSDRIRVTGYLSEQDLEQYLIATDLAVCPFQRASASGSLSTWISVAQPILASNIAQVSEYNDLEPNAIQVFHPYTATALGQSIEAKISRQHDNQAISRLRQQLAISTIFDQHLSCYEETLATR